MMREGATLGVAKAARPPPCTLPLPGRRFILKTLVYFLFDWENIPQQLRVCLARECKDVRMQVFYLDSW